ncbi:sigma-70 family RNA polymerase sigma factor [Streptomyces sp. S063]|uniref:sigma-70 family RNA polymerase sigma factor n=1 Tax=Streptomyces sp. S063 TaxID=2005885 RepID=UPI001F01A84E|nr:sigma-70 family RNA polymerase sigma factor [Streptomyces sp. S063]
MKPQASPKISTLPGAGREPELLALARSGDREAFATLYNEHHAEVSRYIRGHIVDAYLAEDLVQETFLRALRRISTFTWQGREFVAWLVTIARNLIVDHFKALRTRLETPVGDLVDTDALVDSAEDTGLRKLAAVEAADTVHGALLALTPDQHAAIQLRYLNELSISATAKAMRRTEGSVKQLTYRGLTAMRHLAVAA